MNIFDSSVSMPKGFRLIEIFHNAYTAWVILVISLCLTVIAYFVADSFVQQRSKDRFDFKVHELQQAILDRALIYEQVLWGGVGLFNANGGWVDRGTFASYVETLNIDENWPGVQGIGFSVPVEAAQLDAHIDSIRAEGFPDYSVRPEGARDQYSAIIYLEPFDWRNKRAFGYDMWSNDMRREAMTRARDTGRAATSGIITLVQETKEDTQRGFLTYLPVYRRGSIPPTLEERREEFVGWVYAPFRAGNLMHGILSEEYPYIEFEIYDGIDKKPEHLLFDSNNSLHLNEVDHQPDFVTEVQVELQGRVWTLYFNTPKNYLQGTSEARQPAYIAAAGAIVDLLLFYVIYSLYFMNRRIRRISQDWRTIIDQAPNALIVTDKQGYISSANTQANRLFGYQPGELHGRNIEQLLPTLVQHNYAGINESFSENLAEQTQECRHDLEAICKDQQKIPVEVSLTPLRMAQGSYVVASIFDTSEWTRVQKSLEDFNDQLSLKNKEMEQFIYTVSHDLKSPLVTIGGFTSHLMSSLQDQLTEKQAHQLSRIQHNVNHMEGLLGDLLQLSRVIRQEVEKRELVVAELVQQVSNTLETSIRDAQAEISVNTSDLKVYGNERLVLQCLQNLVANAIQYRDPERPLRIEVSVEQLPACTRLHVRDNGMGIEPKYFDKIFRIFERLDVGDGTGVGLAIVKTVMEKHHGRVYVESELGQYSRFTLEFPNLPVLEKQQQYREAI